MEIFIFRYCIFLVNKILEPNLAKKAQISKRIFFILMACLSYRVYLHDPTYHYLVKNPLVSPRIFRQYKDLTTSGGSYQWLYITVTEKKNLNRESQSCEVILVRKVSQCLA